jgi:hypothetical protein
MIYINNNKAKVISNKISSKIEDIKAKYDVVLQYFSITDADFDIYYKMSDKEAIKRLNILQEMLEQSVEEHRKAARTAVEAGLNNKSGAVDIDLHDQNKINNYFTDLKLKFNN